MGGVRYDAMREVEDFSAELAHRVAMDQVIAATTLLLERTLQPDDLGVGSRIRAAEPSSNGRRSGHSIWATYNL